jgi:hypothetical protein
MKYSSIFWVTPEHVSRFQANGFDLAILGRDGDDRRLVDHDAAPSKEDQDVGRSEIDSYLFWQSVFLWCVIGGGG